MLLEVVFEASMIIVSDHVVCKVSWTIFAGREDKPGDSAMSAQVVFCCLSKGPGKCFESCLDNMVWVTSRKLWKKNRSAGLCQFSSLKWGRKTMPSKHIVMLIQSLGEGFFEIEAKYTWRMWSVIPDVFTRDWKKCSTSCHKSNQIIVCLNDSSNVQHRRITTP
jgi:hypothetical protein